MTILIAILAFLLAASIGACVLFRFALLKMSEKYIGLVKAMNEAALYPVAEYECMLMLSLNYEADFDGRVVDFSQYKEKNLITYNCFYKEKNKKEKNKKIVDDLIPNAIVYELNDGSYEWSEKYS